MSWSHSSGRSTPRFATALCYLIPPKRATLFAGDTGLLLAEQLVGLDGEQIPFTTHTCRHIGDVRSGRDLTRTPSYSPKAGPAPDNGTSRAPHNDDVRLNPEVARLALLNLRWRVDGPPLGATCPAPSRRMLRSFGWHQLLGALHDAVDCGPLCPCVVVHVPPPSRQLPLRSFVLLAIHRARSQPVAECQVPTLILAPGRPDVNVDVSSRRSEHEVPRFSNPEREPAPSSCGT